MDAVNGTLTKHEQILRFIENLKIGTKISVRQVAKDLEVSEGTAYRAIKEAETLGIVATKERIGTVRIERKQRNNIENLTFEDVVDIVEGRVLGGKQGLGKTLNKFVIGAMEQDAMMRYIEPGSLLIVGNRNEAHVCALERGAGVLITGGFDSTEEVKRKADKLGWPIISSKFDTFTVASMINRALYDTLIKRKIMLVEDVLRPKNEVVVLKTTSTKRDWQRLRESTGYNRFPVVDEWNRVVGVITSRDVTEARDDQALDRLMTRNPLTVNVHTSVASAAHTMVWEGIELIPVVDGNRKLVGVVTRQDVLQAMQYIQNEPLIGETFEDLIWSGFEECRDEDGSLYFKGIITPQMTTPLGNVSEGVLSTLLTQSAMRVIKHSKRGDVVLENMSTYFIRPLQLESEVLIRVRIIELSRKFGKVDVEITHEGNLAAKAMLTAQMIEHL